MYYLDSVQSNQCFQAIEFVDRPVPEKLYIGFIFCGQEVLQVEGDIVRGGGGGYSTQYRQKNWQIPKIPCQKSTKYRYCIYDWLYIRISISRAFLSRACMHYKSTSAMARKRKKIPRIFYRYNDHWSPIIGGDINSILD